MNFLNTGLIFTPEVFILCRKVWGPGRSRTGDVNFDISDFWKLSKTKNIDFLKVVPGCLVFISTRTNSQLRRKPFLF